MPGDRPLHRVPGARELLEIGLEPIWAEHEAGVPEAPGCKRDDRREWEPERQPGRCARSDRDRALLDDLIIHNEDQESGAEAVGALAPPPAEREGDGQERKHRYGQDTD